MDKYSLKIGDRTLTLYIANDLVLQSSGAVIAQMGDTMVLAAVTYKRADPKNKRDFLPLLVEYREETYAAERSLGVSSGGKENLGIRKLFTAGP